MTDVVPAYPRGWRLWPDSVVVSRERGWTRSGLEPHPWTIVILRLLQTPPCRWKPTKQRLLNFIVKKDRDFTSKELNHGTMMSLKTSAVI